MSTERNMELYRLKAEICKAFSDPKRLIIIDELREGEKSVGELAGTMGISQAVVSRNLSVLRERGVVEARREGTTVYYSLVDKKIGEACAMVHDILLAQIEKNRKWAEELVA